MFPRPRKITRFLVFVFTIIFIFSSFVYIFSSSAEHAPYDVTQLEIRGKFGARVHDIFFMNRNPDSTDNEQLNVSPEYTEEETRALADKFQYSVYSKLQNSAFFRERKNEKCSEDTVVSEESYKTSISNILTKSSSRKPSYVNPHNFTYIHNPYDMCTKRDVSFLVYIHSSPGNLKKRQAIRQTWGDLKLLSLFNATLVFILGATPEKSTQNIVDMEADKYGDIVQENFFDAYRNLTYKGMTALKWAAKFCKCAAFVFKADDDILLDIVSVIDRLVTNVIPAHGANKLVLCNLWTRMKTMRNTKSKWYLSKEEFPPDTFPPYCSGSFFILSADMIPKMYTTALNSKFFWVDDYFITGVLVNALKIKHVAFNQVYLLNYNVVEEKLKNDKKEYMVFHIRQLSLFNRVWPLMRKRHEGMKSFLQNSIRPFFRTTFSFHKHSKLPNGTSVDNGTVTGTTSNITSLHTLLESRNDTPQTFTKPLPTS